MIVSADVPEDLVTKLDGLVANPEPPVWPFTATTLLSSTLSPADHKKLSEYQAAFANYEKVKQSGGLTSRSAVVRYILSSYFSPNGNGKAKKS